MFGIQFFQTNCHTNPKRRISFFFFFKFVRKADSTFFLKKGWKSVKMSMTLGIMAFWEYYGLKNSAI